LTADGGVKRDKKSNPTNDMPSSPNTEVNAASQPLPGPFLPVILSRRTRILGLVEMALKRLDVLVPPNLSEVELVLVVVRYRAKGAPCR
jgi:hypothetical protein